MPEAQAAEISEPEMGPHRSRSRNSFLIVQGVILAGGIGLLAYLLYSLGFGTIIETVGRIGWGFLFIVAINGVRHVFRASCIYLAIEKRHRAVGFHNVLAARLAGEAVNLMTITGPFLGDATKIALLKGRQTLSHSAAAVFVDDILYYVTVGLMILSGVGLFALTVGDVDNAIKAQKKAVELAPQYQIMRRQLAEFEKAKTEAAK